MAQLGISQKASMQLSELSKKRKIEDSLIGTKKGIVEELISIAHQAECEREALSR